MTSRPINRTERLASLETALCNTDDGLSAIELARMLGVDRRTIYRDLSLLSEIGIPVFQREGRFLLNRADYQAAIRFSFDEALALMFAVSLWSRAGGFENEHLDSALKKISRIMPPSLARYIRSLSSSKMSDRQARRLADLHRLCRAWAESRQVRIRYRPRPEHDAEEIVLSTYFVDVGSGKCPIVLGLHEGLRELIQLRLEWIERVRALEARYDIPSNLEDYVRQYMRGLDMRANLAT
ncbi:HTH domain-containing protein [Kamptonema cortianum]|jgi:proteasome accessory factor B|nr:HTH domain-containing protein [Kamptonema cortianum]